MCVPSRRERSSHCMRCAAPAHRWLEEKTRSITSTSTITSTKKSIQVLLRRSYRGVAMRFRIALFTAVFAVTAAYAEKAIELLNVSYDPTRELYEEYNKAFAAHWKQEKGQD